jgi:ABC-type transport system involved in cytochrome c biogenesis permease component
MKFLVTLVFVAVIVTVMMTAFGDMDKMCATKGGRIAALVFWFSAVIAGVVSAYAS